MDQNINYPDPGFWTKTSLIQLGYGLWVNLSMVVLGFSFGFTGIAMPQLKESGIKLTIADQSWIASALTLVAPIGCIISGCLIDKIGRSIMLVLSHLPVAIGWFYTGIAMSAKDLIIGRVITGIGVGMIMSVPRAYLTEISLPNMRGVIGSFPNLAISIGITAQAGFGAFFRWNTICYMCTVYSLTLMIFNYFLPETPYYCLMNNDLQGAEASLRKFRSSNYNITAAMAELKDFKLDNDIHQLTWKENIITLFSKQSCKPFCMIIIYVVFTQLSGIFVVVMWAVEFLERSKSSVDPNMGFILLGITRIIAGVITSILIFKVGRRPLAIVSGLGVGIVCVVLGIYISLHEERSIFPQICYILYISFATFGHYTLPALIMYELFPLQVRGILGGMSISIINLSVFGTNKSYPYVRDSIGFANTIISFGVFSLLGCIYLYFFLPETKDLTLQEIEEYYNETRPSLTSQRRIMSMQFSKQSLSKTDKASGLMARIRNKSKKEQQVKSRVTESTDETEEGTTSNDPPRNV